MFDTLTNRQKSLLSLADSLFVLSHRNAQRIGKYPNLEIEMAMSNISLDMLGQSQLVYAQLGHEIGVSEDELCFAREEREYLHCVLAEQPNTDFAHTLLRNFFFHQYFLHLFEALQNTDDRFAKDFSTKARKETLYHARYTKDWVIRLGDGTEVSHQKMQQALRLLWTFTTELFEPTSFEQDFYGGIGVDFGSLKTIWLATVQTILKEATLETNSDFRTQLKGKEGIHTEYFGYIMAEFQYLPNKYPNSQW